MEKNKIEKKESREGEELIKLEQQLKQAGIDISSWGTGEAKTLEDLKKEIECGETVLVTGKKGELLRKVEVCDANVYYISPEGKKYLLREDKQVFKDGRVRRRHLGQSVSEKMKPGEKPADAMIRGIQEELGIKGKIAITEIGTDEQTIGSPSYPGLQSQYIHHKYEVFLNAEQFNPDGYVEEQKNKTTYFVWEEVE